MSETAAHAGRAGIDHYCWLQLAIETRAAGAPPAPPPGQPPNWIPAFAGMTVRVRP